MWACYHNLFFANNKGTDQPISCFPSQIVCRSDTAKIAFNPSFYILGFKHCLESCHGCKNVNFKMKNCDIFLIFAQNIDFEYMLDPQSMF